MPDATHPAWVRPLPTSEQRAQEIEELERADRAMRRYAYARFGFEYLVWFVIGVAMMFWSFRLSDGQTANLWFWGGMIVGDTGMLTVLVRVQRYFDENGLR
jgi:hypothetical protein